MVPGIFLCGPVENMLGPVKYGSKLYCNIQLVGIVYIAKAKVHLPQTWIKLWGFGYPVLSYLVFLLSKINIFL
jgi:hypothetical protein